MVSGGTVRHLASSHRSTDGGPWLASSTPTRSSTRPRRSRTTTSLPPTRLSARASTARARRWARPGLTTLGALAGTGAAQELGRLANEHRPVLHTHDRYGQRIDVVEYHPAYHDLMRTSLHHGLHAGPWADPAARGPRGPGGQGHRLVPGRRRSHLPRLDDLRRRAGPPAPTRGGPRSGSR